MAGDISYRNRSRHGRERAAARQMQRAGQALARTEAVASVEPPVSDAGQLAGVAGGLPSIPTLLPSDARFNSRGNAQVKISVMQRTQSTYGNRAIQRFMQSRREQRIGALRANNHINQQAQSPANHLSAGLTTAEVVSMVAATPIQQWATSVQRVPAVQRQDGNPVATPAPGTSIHPTLQRGSRGPAVEELQQKLRDAGIRVLGRRISADGKFGPFTERAVRSFQRQEGLPVTGIADAATWERLDASGARSTVGRVERQWSEVVGGVTYGMTSRYTWRIIGNEIRITVKIKFMGLQRPALVQRWFNHIRNIWNRFKVVNPATRESINIEFDPQSVDSGEDNEVQIMAGNGRSDAAHWYAGDPDSDNTAAHEFGHMVGLEDEYQRAHTDYRRITGREPGAGQTGPGGLLGAAQATWIAMQLRSALLDTNQANRITRATAVVTGNNLQQGTYAQQVATAYRTMYNVNVVDDIVARIPDANQWSIVDPFTHSTQSIMGMMGDHTHPVEARHVREFAEAVRRAKGGVWRTVPR